ncbi:MAG: Calx-beta domain protein [Gammaproteobacteria bacterium]|nr:Calx-beta domain protein [Gammaproteobacteria bacterium]
MIRTMRVAGLLRFTAVTVFALVLSACGDSVNPTVTAPPVSTPVSNTGADPLAFSAASYSVAQNAGAVTLTVTRSGPATGAVTVNYACADGTAVAGTDYTAASGTLQWAENDSTAKTISVPVSNTTPFTGNRSFTVTLSAPSATAELADPNVATVTISGDATPAIGSVELSSATYPVAQSAGTMTVTVNRTSGSSGAIGVAYATVNGTAVAGTDYTATSGTLQWANGDASSKTFNVVISNKTSFSGSKGFTVALASPQSGATLGSPSSAQVTITGNTTAPVGNLSLSAASYTVAQSTGTVTVTVNRAGGTNGATSVAYATTGGTAVSGTDFTAAKGTLTWANGDAAAKTFAIAISKTTPFSGNKTLTVALTSPSGGATITSPGSASVTITGSAAAAVGNLELSASTYTVSQNAGTVTVTANRTGGTSGAVSVAYATTNGTAVSGTDFTAASGTLKWADGDAAAKTFAVTISNASPFSGTKSFTVTLSAAAGGATLSTPTTASVSITGSAPAAVGSVQLSGTSYRVAQSAGSLTISANRTGGSSGSITVAYATSNGTATAGTDYTAANGTLSWAAGDATAKTFSIPISTATPFAGSKTLSVALSNPTGGATLTTPSTATVTIAGAGGTGSGGPSTVDNLQLVNEGGPGNSTDTGHTGSLTNYQQISWAAATPGANPIASYNIYRNGALYDNTTALSYTDTNAPNSNVPNWSAPATVYSYNVAAVDTQGNVGPLATQMSMYAYQDGHSNWSNGDLTYGGAVTIYASTAGNPQGGTYDVSTVFATGGGFLPTADAPQCPVWDCEIGAFNYFTIDINPGPIVSPYVQLITQARLPPGDDGAWANGLNVFNYGPAPQPNTWATYKVPLKALHIGISTFTGSISGTTLTVTAVSSQGMGAVDADGFVTGPGVPAGTYVTQFGQVGSIGTFTIAGPGINSGTSVPSETMTFQRTNLYKFGLQPNSNPVTMYWNNFGFTVN